MLDRCETSAMRYGCNAERARSASVFLPLSHKRCLYPPSSRCDHDCTLLCIGVESLNLAELRHVPSSFLNTTLKLRQYIDKS